MRPVRRGHKGKQVVDIQTRLAALGYLLGDEGADGFFGPNTEDSVRSFQQTRLLDADGIVDENTWTELVEAGYEIGDRLLYLRVPYLRGDDVLYVQRTLDELGFDSGPVDGIFTPALEEAVTEFQRNAGLIVDGIVGETTFDRLRHLRQAHPGGSPAGIPDRMNGYVGRRALPGLKVCVDAAHGGSDPGHVVTGGSLEKDLNLQLANALSDLLEGSGVEVDVVRKGDTGMSLYKRIEHINAGEPDIYISLHHAWSPNPEVGGVAAYYFANSAYQSRAGRRLAGYIVDAISNELERTDLHKHGRNYACLREVKPLAVQVEVGFMSHPDEGRALGDPDVTRREAVAILHGIERYLARL